MTAASSVSACRDRVHQVVRRAERRLQRIEGRLARRQRFGVAHEFEARVDAVADDVREVVEIQGGDVLGAILQPQRTEGPVERVAFAVPVVDVVLERCKARTFGQVVPRGDAMSQARIATLQKSNRRRNRACGRTRSARRKSAWLACAVCGAARSPARGWPRRPFDRQQPERQGDGEIRSAPL